MLLVTLLGGIGRVSGLLQSQATACSLTKIGSQWEQKWLAQQVKWDFTADEREEMFLQWNVHKESKQRKLQLIKCLWSAKTLRWFQSPQLGFEIIAGCLIIDACL